MHEVSNQFFDFSISRSSRVKQRFSLCMRSLSIHITEINCKSISLRDLTFT